MNNPARRRPIVLSIPGRPQEVAHADRPGPLPAATPERPGAGRGRSVHAQTSGREREAA
jgi:hypothetical protein